MKSYSLHEEQKASPEKTRRRKQRKNKKNKKTELQNYYKRERELRKEGRESLDVSPYARDQSKRVSLKEASI